MRFSSFAMFLTSSSMLFACLFSMFLLANVYNDLNSMDTHCNKDEIRYLSRLFFSNQPPSIVSNVRRDSNTAVKQMWFYPRRQPCSNISLIIFQKHGVCSPASITLCLLAFLDASSDQYKRVCSTVPPSVTIKEKHFGHDVTHLFARLDLFPPFICLNKNRFTP